VLICAIDATICWMTTVHASIAASLLLGFVATFMLLSYIHSCTLLYYIISLDSKNATLFEPILT
jgi:hypothetical protein